MKPDAERDRGDERHRRRIDDQITSESDDQLIISVGDTGVGGPLWKVLAERIFDPFHTTKPQGTGRAG